MTVYTSQIATALRLLSAKGQAITLARVTTGTFDPVAGTETGGSSATQALVGVVMPASYATRGGLVQNTTTTVMVAASGVSIIPRPGDKITLSTGQVLSVLTVEEMAPDGTAIYWTLGVEA